MVWWAATLLAAVLLSALVSGWRRSPFAVVACLVGIALGFGGILLWQELSHQRIEFVNETPQPLTVLHDREGQPQLYRTGPPSLAPGAVWKDIVGFEKTGPWLRIVAVRSDGKRVFDHTYTWGELSQMGDRIVFTSDEPLPD